MFVESFAKYIFYIPNVTVNIVKFNICTFGSSHTPLAIFQWCMPWTLGQVFFFPVQYCFIVLLWAFHLSDALTETKR